MAACFPLSFGIIRDEFPRDKINSGLSVVASLAAVGFGIGIVAAGPIVDVLSYHWLFWIPMITTALAALGAATLVPESPVRTARTHPTAAGGPALGLAGRAAPGREPGQPTGAGGRAGCSACSPERSASRPRGSSSRRGCRFR